MVGIFRPTIIKCMDVADKFMPTAGTVGLLPMVTYFFLVVALFSFLSSFLFALFTRSDVRSEYRIAHTMTAILAIVLGLTYYLIQRYYHDALTELVTVTDANDRQTLIRESYNAIGQYRYIGWFVAAPLLLTQTIFRLNGGLSDSKRPSSILLIAASFMFFVSYIGHQQLSFDNEIEVGKKVTWGFVASVDYVFILFMLSRLWKQFGQQAPPANQRIFRRVALIALTGWGIYLVGYFLTITTIDFNWIHIIFTIADVMTVVGSGILIYFVGTKSAD